MLRKQLDVLWVARYDYRPGWSLKKHQHKYFQMIYIIDGKSDFVLEPDIFKTEKGKLFIIKPQLVHGILKVGKDKLKTLDIKFLLKNKQLSKKINKIKVLEYPQARDYLEKIKKEGLNKNPDYKEFCALYLYELIRVILRQKENKRNIQQKEKLAINEENGVCTQFKKYISKNYGKDLSLKKIAKDLGYNASYICQKFNENTDFSPMQFLYKYRIEKAKELIIYGDFSLKQIAFMTGFKSVHHFSRLFHEYTGFTPGDYRGKESDNIRKNVYIKDEFKNIDLTERNEERTKN